MEPNGAKKIRMAISTEDVPLIEKCTIHMDHIIREGFFFIIGLFNSRHFKISADVLIMSVSRFIHGNLHETTESTSKNYGVGYFKLYFYKNINV